MTMRSLLPACALLALLLPGCGYHLGGLRCRALTKMDTFCVNMFANYSTQPTAAVLMTTALTDNLQRDGSFRMASPSECDFVIDGKVTHLHRGSLSTNWRDSYISNEIGLTIHVDYVVRNNKTKKVLMRGSTSASGSYFNKSGNIQSAREAALSYAARKAAENIVYQLTIP